MFCSPFPLLCKVLNTRLSIVAPEIPVHQKRLLGHRQLASFTDPRFFPDLLNHRPCSCDFPLLRRCPYLCFNSLRLFISSVYSFSSFPLEYPCSFPALVSGACPGSALTSAYATALSPALASDLGAANARAPYSFHCPWHGPTLTFGPAPTLNIPPPLTCHSTCHFPCLFPYLCPYPFRRPLPVPGLGPSPFLDPPHLCSPTLPLLPST